jgi:uncharacterized protein involved in exopolysaccharide biosynthesis
MARTTPNISGPSWPRIAALTLIAFALTIALGAMLVLLRG